MKFGKCMSVDIYENQSAFEFCVSEHKVGN